MENCTRRNFVKGAGAGLAGAALMGMASGALADEAVSEEAASSDTPAYDYEADVVIVGAGGAGQMAAVGAHENGASSIMLEKAAYTGGDSITSHNDLLGYWPDHAGENGDDFDAYLEDWKATHWVSVMG